MTRCFIGLGSNLNRPEQQLRAAVAGLEAHPAIHFTALSPLYGNPAVGPGQQPDYVNAVAEVATDLAPPILLRELQAIENRQGRIRTERWGARTLDLDLLLYGSQQIAAADLIVPHPRLAERSFVLYPLFDLAPDLILPDGTPLRALLDCCPGAGLERL